MDTFPASIESTFGEAGFTGTEVIIIRKLMEEDALTLRELAAKTGKSTGVLDQAVKKLMAKGVVEKKQINETNKYALRSLQNVVDWMHQDMKSRQAMMVRRFENFESFVKSLTIIQEKKRPEIEHFEGVEGVKKAYMEVLNRGNELVQFGPTVYLTEEDPLRDFKVQWFRERQRRGIFLRVITHNTILGRRFHSRDPFEYRRTLLVEEESYPTHFETIIAGDTVACFHPKEDRAVFVRYPEMALEEKMFFDRIWNKKIKNAPQPEPAVDENGKPAKEPLPIIDAIPFRTKALSQVREFFLSRRSISVLLAFAAASALVTYGLYLRDVSLNTKRIQERALSIAATGALQFDPNDIQQLWTLRDIEKPEYARVVYQLNLIRSLNSGVRYAYIMRPTDNPELLEFVADADALNPYAKGDLNKDGSLDSADELPSPGRSYDVKDFEPMQLLFSSGEPTVDDHPETDQWGTFLSGYGPIKDREGNVIALFGVDIEASMVQSLSRNMVVLGLIFVGLFVLLILVRMFAFNRSVFKEITEVLKSRRNFLMFFAGLLLAIASSTGLYFYGIHSSINQVREKVTVIATTAASQFNPDDLDQLHTIDDIQKPEYGKVLNQLHQIRSNNSDILYTYLFRPFPKTTTFEFIADSYAYGIDIFTKPDVNGDGIYDAADEVGYPGLPYDISHIDELVDGLYYSPLSTHIPYTDKWGTVLSGYAPIKRSNGEVSALLAVDVDVEGLYLPSLHVFFPVGIYLILVGLYVLLWMPDVRKSLAHSLAQKVLTKRVMYTAAFVLMILYWVVFGLIQYRQYVIKEETGKRLVAIASTAASQINPDDLINLRFARDMKTAEYQRVFKLLNDIRNSNPGIVYVYILRPTEVEGIWEFVVDVDSNYFIPFIDWDYTGDGLINESDENSPPGVRFDMEFSFPKVFSRGLYQPVFEDSLILNQWGAGYSGCAPILKNANPLAILCVDGELEYAVEMYEN